ncbi:unnamed protein product [Ambrosiozyma monospora]|uniref:Unnamed protein product n=1 Tax=Ambrosiozyma monospora TaxID=43982 RepID=A0ACB5TA86_AMBMO|nr:unnamed protein product [Ambrosiozyma monospora]
MSNSGPPESFKKALDDKNYDDAFQILQSHIIKSNSFNVESLLQLSEIQLKRSNIDSALQFANRAIQLCENEISSTSSSPASSSSKLRDCYKQKSIVYFQLKLYSQAFQQIVLAGHVSSGANADLDNYRMMIETVYKMGQSKIDDQLKSEEQLTIKEFNDTKKLLGVLHAPKESEIPESYKQKQQQSAPAPAPVSAPSTSPPTQNGTKPIAQLGKKTIGSNKTSSTPTPVSAPVKATSIPAAKQPAKTTSTPTSKSATIATPNKKGTTTTSTSTSKGAPTGLNQWTQSTFHYL